MMKKILLFLMFALFCIPWAANAQVSIPYTEGFENMSSTDDLTAAGWISYNSESGSVLNIETSAGNVNSGSKALNMDSWSAATNSAILVAGLPVVDAAINTLQITFSYKVSTGTVDVGYLTDVNDASTFVSLQSYGSSSSYTTKTVDLNEAPATAARIAIKYTNYFRCYVDDIEVKVLPSCSKPTSVTATPDGNVTWEGEGTTWNLNYRASSASTWTEVNGLTSMSYTIPNLISFTTYSVRVQNVCDDNSTTDWTTATFTTPAGIPLVESFDGSNTPAGWARYSGLLNDVLDGTVTLQTITSGWSFGTSNSVFDDHARVNVYGTYCKYWLVTPALTMENNVQLSFDVAYTAYSGSGAPAQNGSDDKFVVLITTDGGTTWTVLRQWDNAGSEYVLNNLNPSPVTVTYDLSSYAGQNIAVAFYAESTTSNADNNLHIDNVSIDYIPSCQKPTDLNATNITTNSAELSWVANSGETAWTLYWKESGATDYTEVANVTANSYTLSGLTASAKYQYYVVANCSSEDASEPSNEFTFVTACDAIAAVGYSENFDSYTAGNNVLPTCWSYINTTTNSSYAVNPRVYANSSYTTYASTAPNCLYLYSYGSDDPQPQYAILPEMTGLAGLQVTLMAKGYNASSTFKIGTMSDPTDAGTFTMIAEQTLTTSYPTVPFEYIIPANCLDSYLAIMIDAAPIAYNTGVYVDDIVIREAPTCLKPTDLTVVANSVTAHTAQLSWVSDATAWIVAYKTNDDADFTEVNATENPFTLTGLTDATAYTAKVRAVCDGTPSEWSSTIVNFTTPIFCPAPTNLAYSGITGSQTTLNWSGTSDSYDVLYRTAAYTEGFYEEFGTSIPSGWEMYTGLLSNGTATMTSASYGWNFGTGNGVFDNHARVNIYGNNQRWLVTPNFTVLQEVPLSFDLALTAYSGNEVPAPATSGTDDKFIVLVSTDNMATWTTLREWNNEDGSEYMYNNISNTATGEHVSIDLGSYVGQNVRIAFYGESTASNADNNLHIDNVSCGIPHEAGEWQTAAEGVTGTTYTLTNLNPETDYEAKVLSNCEGETGHETAAIRFTTEAACMVPNELEVVSVTPTTAQLTWTSTSTAWQIQVNEEDPIDVTAIPYTLEGLTPATTYIFRVRAYCDGTYTEWSNAEGFITDCDAITTFPWSEDFESFEASSSGITFDAPCWVNEHISGYGSYFFEVYSGTNGTNSTKQLRLRDMTSGTMTKLMLPEMTLPSNDYLFSIDVYRNATGTSYPEEGIRVYASTDGEIDGATELAFISRNCTVSDENLIPAESTSGWYTYELPIGISGTCYIILRGESKYGSSTYMDNFAVKQMPTCLKPSALECTATTATAATFSWTNGAADQTAWQIMLNGDEENLIMANSNPFTVEGLTAATSYTAKVRAYCGEEDQSEWSNEVNFATECEAIVVDVANPFTEDFEGDWTPPCWKRISLSSYFWSSNISHPHSGSASAFSGYYGPVYLVMPDLQLGTDGDAAKLTFWSYNTYVSDYEKNSVVLLDGENEIELWSPESVAQSLEETTIDLTAYMGQTISIAFKYEGNNAHGWYVDDVDVTLVPPCGIVLNEPDYMWEETFESYTVEHTDGGFTNYLPDCWTLVKEYTGASPDLNNIGLGVDTLPQVFYYPSFDASTGNQTLRMKFHSLLAMPELDESVDMSRLHLSMWVRQPQTYYHLQVGVLTDLADDSTFEPLVDIDNESTNMEHIELDFSRYQGEGRYIAFKNLGGSSSNPYCTQYLDDIVLTYNAAPAACGISSLAYEEDFEGYTTNTVATGVEPDCWEVIDEISALDFSTKPQLYAGFNTTEGGNYTLRMLNRCVYAMPELSSDIDVNTLTMTFNLRQPKAVYRLQVGVLDADNNFVLVEEINNASADMEDVRVDFTDYTGTGHRIAFRNVLNGRHYKYSYNYLDDIHIDLTANMPAPEPAKSISNMTDGSEEYLNRIAVYPNPTTGMLHIDAVDVQKVECYNQMGKLVGVYDNVNELNISELANGVYTLRITVPQGVTMRKVVKR